MIGLPFLQVGGAVPTSPVELVTHATTITQIVLVILAVLSLISWAIIIAKWLEFRRVAEAGRALERDFEHLNRLDELRTLIRRARPSPFTRVVTRALEFQGAVAPPMSAATDVGSPGAIGGMGGVGAVGVAPEPGVRAARGSQIEALRLVTEGEATFERDRLARFVPTLAVIGSVSPLLGLLGTVLGVIDAFLGIASQGSGNLAAVAPGVAEALIATAAALMVAIPAVFGYNIFASRLTRFENALDGFGTETIALMVREGQL